MSNLVDWRTLTCRCGLEFLFSGNSNVFFSYLPSRNCPLAVNPLPLDSMWVLHAHYIFERIYAFVSDKAEPTRLPGPFIFQNGTIFNLAILHKVLLEFLVAQVVRKAANEYLSELVIHRWWGSASRLQSRRSRIRLLDLGRLLLILHRWVGLGATRRLGEVLREALQANVGCVGLLVGWRGTMGRLPESGGGWRLVVGVINESLQLTLIRLLGLQWVLADKFCCQLLNVDCGVWAFESCPRHRLGFRVSLLRLMTLYRGTCWLLPKSWLLLGLGETRLLLLGVLSIERALRLRPGHRIYLLGLIIIESSISLSGSLLTDNLLLFLELTYIRLMDYGLHGYFLRDGPLAIDLKGSLLN